MIGDFLYVFGPVWIIMGVIMFVGGIALTAGAYNKANRRGYATKTHRQEARFGWLLIIGATTMPLAIVPAVLYGLYRLSQPARKSFRMAFGKSEVE